MCCVCVVCRVLDPVGLQIAKALPEIALSEVLMVRSEFVEADQDNSNLLDASDPSLLCLATCRATSCQQQPLGGPRGRVHLRVMQPLVSLCCDAPFCGGIIRACASAAYQIPCGSPAGNIPHNHHQTPVLHDMQVTELVSVMTKCLGHEVSIDAAQDLLGKVDSDNSAHLDFLETVTCTCDHNALLRINFANRTLPAGLVRPLR